MIVAVVTQERKGCLPVQYTNKQQGNDAIGNIVISLLGTAVAFLCPGHAIYARKQQGNAMGKFKGLMTSIRSAVLC